MHKDPNAWLSTALWGNGATGARNIAFIFIILFMVKNGHFVNRSGCTYIEILLRFKKYAILVYSQGVPGCFVRFLIASFAKHPPTPIRTVSAQWFQSSIGVKSCLQAIVVGFICSLAESCGI